MAEKVRKKWEVCECGKVLTGHSLGYLAGLVKILFQLDILSRKCPRGGGELTRGTCVRAQSLPSRRPLVDAVVVNSFVGRDVIRAFVNHVVHVSG